MRDAMTKAGCPLCGVFRFPHHYGLIGKYQSSNPLSCSAGGVSPPASGAATSGVISMLSMYASTEGVRSKKRYTEEEKN